MVGQARAQPLPGVRFPRLALLAAVVLIAANLRSPITGVGPPLNQIAAGLGTTQAALGLLAAIPLVAFAAVSPVAHALSVRFGMSRVVMGSLIALALGTVWRSLPGPGANVWAGTVLIGAALAIVNVLLPAVIKRDFADRVPAITSVFTACLSGAGALASGVVVPISLVPVGGGQLGWRGALLWSGALVPVAIAAWAVASARGRRAASSATLPPVIRPVASAAASRNAPHDDARSPHAASPPGALRASRWGMWADPVAWQVLAYMGVQAMTFYMLVTWLAPLSHSLGRAEDVAGADVMLLQVSSLVGSLLVPLILRHRLARWAPALVPLVGLAALAGLIAAPGLLLGWVLLFGLTSGASLATSFSLFGLRAATHAAASRLSGMAQSGGYAIAALGPVAFGGLLTLTGGWLAPLLLVALVLVAQFGVGLFVGRERQVLAPR